LARNLELKFAVATSVGLSADDVVDKDAPALQSGTIAPKSTVLLDKVLGEFDNDTEALAQVEAGRIAPCTTEVLSSAMLAQLGDEEDENDVSAGAGFKAPCTTAVLSGAQLAGLADEDDEQGEQAAGPVKGGLRAPCTTAVLTKSELDLMNDDEEEVEVQTPVQAGLQAPCTTAVLSGAQLAELDDECDGAEEEVEAPVKAGLKAPCTTAVLTSAQLDVLDEEDEEAEAPARAGLRAPCATAVLGAARLNGLDDDEREDGAMPTGSGIMQAQPKKNLSLLNGLGVDEPAVATVRTGTVAPHTTTVLSAEQLANLEDEEIDERGCPGPVFAGTSKLDQPLAASCAMRLAWLSTEEIGHENAKLREEICALRGEIDRHREELRRGRVGPTAQATL